MKKIVLIASFTVLGLAGSALAQDGAQAPSAAPAVAAAEVAQTAEQTAEEARLQEVHCRTARVTGSRTRVNRTCMTRAEWRELENRTREDVNNMQGQGSGGYQCTRDAQGGCS